MNRSLVFENAVYTLSIYRLIYKHIYILIYLQMAVCLSSHSPVPCRPLCRIQRRSDLKHHCIASLAQKTHAPFEGAALAMPWAPAS